MRQSDVRERTAAPSHTAGNRRIKYEDSEPLSYYPKPAEFLLLRGNASIHAPFPALLKPERKIANIKIRTLPEKTLHQKPHPAL